MTKKERATVQNFINKLSEVDKVRDETLKALQQINAEHGDGHVWCSWKANLDGVLKNQEGGSVWCRRAESQYELFLKASGQYDLIMEFGQALADIGFWK